MTGLAVFGWIVIACITAYCAKQTFNIFRLSMGFTGRLCGEFYVMAVVTAVFASLSYYTFPFHLSLALS